ncbi:MAG: DUF952 domain-containing protein [Chloroflexi bacterium]|nr:DUF952 domain-containing protein [Chloroflexota bacterium]
MIYHITSRTAWLAAQECGWYSAPTLASEGFIHCSGRDQILQVANTFYLGARDLLLLRIDESRLRAELRWEAPAHPDSETVISFPDETVFPHLYGELNLDAVLQAVELAQTEEGFALPSNLP